MATGDELGHLSEDIPIDTAEACDRLVKEGIWIPPVKECCERRRRVGLRASEFVLPLAINRGSRELRRELEVDDLLAWMSFSLIWHKRRSRTESPTTVSMTSAFSCWPTRPLRTSGAHVAFDMPSLARNITDNHAIALTLSGASDAYCWNTGMASTTMLEIDDAAARPAERRAQRAAAWTTALRSPTAAQASVIAMRAAVTS